MLLVRDIDEAIRHLESRKAGAQSEAKMWLRDIDLNNRYKKGERGSATAGQSGRLSNTEYSKLIARCRGQEAAFDDAIRTLQALKDWQEGQQ